MVYLTLLLATFVVGFFNALVHAKDGWATMPTGLILSAVVVRTVKRPLTCKPKADDR